MNQVKQFFSKGESATLKIKWKFIFKWRVRWGVRLFTWTPTVRKCIIQIMNYEEYPENVMSSLRKDLLIWKSGVRILNKEYKIFIQKVFPNLKWNFLGFFLAYVPLSIDIKGALSGLRQLLATESRLKIMKNAFHFP